MVDFEQRTYSVTQCVLAVQGHKVDDFATHPKHVCDFLYLSFIVTLVLSCTVSEIRRLIGSKLQIIPTPLIPLNICGEVNHEETSHGAILQ